MKKFVFSALIFASFTFLASGSYALPGLDLSAGIDVAAPVGDFGDAAKTGYGINIDAFLGLPLFPMKVGGHVAYNRFDIKNSSTKNVSIVEIVPSVRYSILPLGFWDVYAQAGVGYYYFSNSLAGFSSKNKFGFNVGAGVSGMVLPTLSIYVMPMYNMIFTKNTNTTYVSVNVGLKF